MATHVFHGKVQAEAGAAAGELVTKSQLDSVLAQAIARANHTGTQTAATISDFTTAVNALIAAVIDGAPGALDTLNELAAALGDDADFAGTITALITAIDERVDDLEAAGGAGDAGFAVAVGDAVETTFTVTHNLGTKDVFVEVVRVSNGQTVFPVVTRPTINTVLVDFGATVPTAAQFRVLVRAANA